MGLIVPKVYIHVKERLSIEIMEVVCHGLIPYNMSIKSVRPLGINTMDGSWSVNKDEVGCMEIKLVSLYGIPKHNDVSGIGENATKSVVF
jgi:hypothetical protein